MQDIYVVGGTLDEAIISILEDHGDEVRRLILRPISPRNPWTQRILNICPSIVYLSWNDSESFTLDFPTLRIQLWHLTRLDWNFSEFVGVVPFMSLVSHAPFLQQITISGYLVTFLNNCPGRLPTFTLPMTVTTIKISGPGCSRLNRWICNWLIPPRAFFSRLVTNADSTAFRRLATPAFSDLEVSQRHRSTNPENLKRYLEVVPSDKTRGSLTYSPALFFPTGPSTQGAYTQYVWVRTLFLKAADSGHEAGEEMLKLHWSSLSVPSEPQDCQHPSRLPRPGDCTRTSAAQGQRECAGIRVIVA